MKNECEKCGGGIRPGYTAPEARCRCKEIDDSRHEMLLAESDFLRRCGWVPVDLVSLKEGYAWVLPDHVSKPVPQDEAVTLQKGIDKLLALPKPSLQENIN